MLYNLFKLVMMISSFVGFFIMLDRGHNDYVVFPIALFTWGMYSLLKSTEGFFNFDDEYKSYPYDKVPNDVYSSYRQYNGYNDGHVIRMNQNDDNEDWWRKARGGSYNNISYNGMSKKCKRNFKITINK